MNRSRRFDSKLSLDVEAGTDDSSAMLAQPYRLYFERTDATKNMARFYALSIEPTLFGTPCLTRRWGRIGSNGQAKAHHFACEEDAVAMFLDLLQARRARGYRTRPVEKARDANGQSGKL